MNEDVQRIQLTIEEAEKRIETANKWKKLIEVPLFKELITEGYLDKDAVRISMSLNPDQEKNTIAHNMLLAKTIFSRYVGNAIEDGYQAEISLAEHKEALAEVDAEEAEVK